MNKKLIIGLGNPGKEYNNTRHNIGFEMLDYIYNGDYKEKFNGKYSEVIVNNNKIILVKPLSYMNLSGKVVKDFIKYYEVDINDILVIQDDLDMELGKIKFVYNSSNGGHNGIKDIINCLGTKEFLRLKIGISKNNNVDTRDFVLGKFSKKEEEIINESYSKLKDLINDFCNLDNNGLMNKYNNK